MLAVGFSSCGDDEDSGNSPATTSGTTSGTTAGTTSGTTAGTTSGTSSGTTSGTTAGTTSGTQNFTMIGSANITPYQVECGPGSNGGNYFYLSALAPGNGSDVFVQLSNQPNTNTTYTVIASPTAVPNFTGANQATVAASEAGTGNVYRSIGGGQVMATMDGGKVRVSFTNIAAHDDDDSISSTISGSFACD